MNTFEKKNYIQYFLVHLMSAKLQCESANLSEQQHYSSEPSAPSSNILLFLACSEFDDTDVGSTFKSLHGDCDGDYTILSQ